MKKIFLMPFVLFITTVIVAQSYPEPEFSKEVYYLKKDNPYSVIRLEKGSSKMESKTKMGGMGGSESGYLLDGEKSTVRLNGGINLSFVFSNGSSGSSSANQRDSMMKANGIDPSMIQGVGNMNDPASTLTLYKVESANSKRKVLLQKSPGMMPFGSKKQKSSDKYTFSVKKVREGYWNLVNDKNLPKGEYAFTMIGMGNMDSSTTLFAFGID